MINPIERNKRLIKANRKASKVLKKNDKKKADEVIIKKVISNDGKD